MTGTLPRIRVICLKRKGRLKEGDQSSHSDTDTDQKEKVQVLDSTSRAELTENNLYKLQILKMYLKIT